MSDDTRVQYWFNTATQQVDVGHLKPGATLMGPYASRAEAEAALETARRRTEAWDREEAEEDERRR
jgi:hypothetical protein